MVQQQTAPNQKSLGTRFSQIMTFINKTWKRNIVREALGYIKDLLKRYNIRADREALLKESRVI